VTQVLKYFAAAVNGVSAQGLVLTEDLDSCMCAWCRTPAWAFSSRPCPVLQSSTRFRACQPLHIKGFVFVLIHVYPCRIRGNGEVIKREEFDQRKAAAEAARLARLQRKPQKLVSQGKNLEGYPLLQVIQQQTHIHHAAFPCT
jgi:hypothetical protein